MYVVDTADVMIHKWRNYLTMHVVLVFSGLIMIILSNSPLLIISDA